MPALRPDVSVIHAQQADRQGNVLLWGILGVQKEAVFAAKKGNVEGPVKTQFGWYVFEVEKITPASQQSLEEATDRAAASAWRTLTSDEQQRLADIGGALSERVVAACGVTRAFRS